MEILTVAILAIVVALVAVVVGLALRGSGRTRHRFTRRGLRDRALQEARRLFLLVERREASRPVDDPVIKDHEYPHRRVTLHDEETQGIYFEEHLPVVTDLREQFAGRRVRNRTLEEHYESVENSADVRTVATALEEMAERLG